MFEGVFGGFLQGLVGYFGFVLLCILLCVALCVFVYSYAVFTRSTLLHRDFKTFSQHYTYQPLKHNILSLSPPFYVLFNFQRTHPLMVQHLSIPTHPSSSFTSPTHLSHSPTPLIHPSPLIHPTPLSTYPPHSPTLSSTHPLHPPIPFIHPSPSSTHPPHPPILLIYPSPLT